MACVTPWLLEHSARNGPVRHAHPLRQDEPFGLRLPAWPIWATAVSEQPALGGQGRHGSARADIQLDQDVGHVAVDRVVTDDQALRDLAVGQPGRDEPDNLELTW